MSNILIYFVRQKYKSGCLYFYCKNIQCRKNPYQVNTRGYTGTWGGGFFRNALNSGGQAFAPLFDSGEWNCHSEQSGGSGAFCYFGRAGSRLQDEKELSFPICARNPSISALVTFCHRRNRHRSEGTRARSRCRATRRKTPLKRNQKGLGRHLCPTHYRLLG